MFVHTMIEHVDDLLLCFWGFFSEKIIPSTRVYNLCEDSRVVGILFVCIFSPPKLLPRLGGFITQTGFEESRTSDLACC